MRMSFLGLFPFTAPYLAWVLLAFSMVMGNPPTTDVVGICVGHSYYWLESVSYTHLTLPTKRIV